MEDNQEQKKSVTLETLFHKACVEAEAVEAGSKWWIYPMGMTTWVDGRVHVYQEGRESCLN